ncbi:RNA-binding motif protein, X chromosome-like [Ruditapes philippinarum]|uniref:RNA-binding motif protein, X chromosome-like n=1 Tax=Ruditapes philippinarum TaxID=129788 RepID=UPI00295B5E6C|nr:RNA-binding motif protein, X chromosome-like [Ruditapes philippinarum]XP_060559895.1 RNA-binding motif protein, X chromosome-like [Ruditapes philippinarum]
MEDRPGKIFVGGLDFDIDEEEFEKIFAKFGKVTEVLLKRDQQNCRSRGLVSITYENPSDADDAVKSLDKQDLKGKMVHVDHAVKPGRIVRGW